MSALISVIVVNYNAGALLRGCVDSILSCPVDVEIVVVDNASQDNSLDALAGLPHLQIIKNSINTGFASACNTGLRASSGPYVLFLNPDCSFKPGALAELVKALDSDPTVGMVGGLLTNIAGVFALEPDFLPGNNVQNTVVTVVAPQLAMLGSVLPKANGAFEFSVSGQPGIQYVIEASTNLVNWTTIGSNFSLGGKITITDTQAVILPNRFYRARQQP